MRRRDLLAAGALAPGLARRVHADPALLALLRPGGQVVLTRHAQTDPGVGDPEGMVLADCATQRNLSEAGRAQAAAAGAALRTQQVPLERLISSPWCRCVDTARIAFGRAPETSPALGNLFGRGDLQGRQVAQMKALVERPAAGNRVLVSHGSTIQALTGVCLAPAEMLVVTPQGGGRFAVAGRLPAPAR
jgi:broad specificity phosphatase PhoE